MSRKSQKAKAAAFNAAKKKAEIENIKKEAEKEVGIEEKEKPNPTPEPEPTPAPKPEPTPEPTTEPESKPEPKIPKVVIPPTTSVDKQQRSSALSKGLQASALNALANGDRISANNGIMLMNMIHQNYISDTDLPPQLKDVYKKTFDAMSLRYIVHWMAQTKLELGDVGIKVNSEAFDAISEGLALYYGIETKLLPTATKDDKQLSIQFNVDGTTAEEIRESINESEKSKNTPLPVYNKNMSEADILNSLKTIMNAKNKMGTNLTNAIAFARKAFNMEKSPAYEVVAAIMAHTPDGEKPGRLSSILLNGYGHMCYGLATTNNGPFAAQARLKEILADSKLSDAELSGLARLFFALGAELNLTNLNKTKKNPINIIDYINPWNKFFKGLTDTTINNMVATIKDKTKIVQLPKIDGIIAESMTSADCAKVLEKVRKAYGTNLNDKQLKTTMSKILNEYRKQDINPLSVYVEKYIPKEEKK